VDITTISILGAATLVILSIIYAIIKLIRKKNIKVIVQEVEVPILEKINQTPPVESFIPIIKSPDRQLYEKFIKTYDSGDLKFNNTPYRPGASYGGPFGIAEGYRYYVKDTNRLWNTSQPINQRQMRWGYVRPHSGVDRAGAKTYTMKNGHTVKDVVRSPFDFNRSRIIDYGDYSYGTLISLFNDEYEFELRIAHMKPGKDILPWSLNRLKNNGSFKVGWVLGSAGTYGYSSGNHTHTEFVSLDESCEVFDILIEEAFGAKALKEYTTAQIVKEYKKHKHFKEASERTILEDWDAWKRKRRIMFANPYKMTRINPADGKSIMSWYSSYLLFNKL